MSAAHIVEGLHGNALATAEQYGGPLGAALAMQLTEAGLYTSPPDTQTINAIARRRMTNTTDDVESVLGAALSCTEAGNEVLFMGQAFNVEGYTPAWQEVLAERSSQAQVSGIMPAAQAIAGLLGRGWTLLLHASGEAFGRSDMAVHPVLLTHANSRQLVVNNPGAEGMKPAASQHISARLALDGIRQVNSSRVSLFGVRRPVNGAQGTCITSTKPNHYTEVA